MAVAIVVDNDADVYWNGNMIAPRIVHDFCPALDDTVLTVPAELIVDGQNLFAVRGIDRGSVTYFDAAVRSSLTVPAEQLFGFPGQFPWGQYTSNLFGDPVNTATGSFTYEMRDIELPGNGVPFELVRTYNSADPTQGPLGKGWTHSFAASISVEPDGDVRFRAGNGQQLLFTRQPDGAFTDPPGGRAELVADAGGYSLTRTDQVVYRFDASGRLVSIKDRSANTLSIRYSRDGGPIRDVTDSAGRQIRFTHNSAALLTRVELPDGRFVQLAYTNGLLTSFTDLRGNTTTYTYDGSGRLATIVDPNAHTEVRSVYGADGRVIEQYDAFDNRTTFAWDPSTATSTVTDPSGASWVDSYAGNVLQDSTAPSGTSSFEWSGDLGVTAGSDPRGNQFTMTYDAAGNMLSRTAPAPLSFVEEWTYDARNNVTSYKDGRDNTTTYAYDTAGRLVQETKPGGTVRSWTYTAKGQVATATDARGNTTNYAYDAAGNLTSVQTPLGNKTTYTYDSAGRVLTMVEPRGNAPGADPAEFQTSWTYDAAGNVLTETDPLGRVTTNTYDAAGNLATVTDPLQGVTRYTYNSANELVSEEAPDGSVTSYVYDDRGLLTRKTEPLDRVTTYTYDPSGRLATMVSPRGNVSGADPAQFRWTYGYDPNGNRTSVTDPLGGVTTSGYDVLNRLISVRDPREFTTSYEYDANANQTEVIDALNGTTTNTYDALNRQVAVQDPRGNTTSHEYDANGNRTKVTEPTGAITTFAHDADNRLANTVEPRGNVAGANPDEFRTVFTYDPAGNRLTQADPLGNTMAFSYDRVGNMGSRQDALSRITGFAYDPLNRLTSVTAPDSTVTSYGYDSVGNLTTRTDAKNRVTSHGYDAARRLISLLTPAGQQWGYEYDANSNQIKMVDAAGNATPSDPNDGTTSRTFDRLDRLTAVDYSDGTPDVQFGYDANGNRTSMTDGSGTETSVYNALNRQTRVTRGTNVFEYVYDASSNIVSRTYPDGTIVGQPRRPDNRISAVTVNGAAAATYGYDIAGNLATTAYPAGNGYVETRSYDRAGRLTEVRNAKDGAALSFSTLTLDPVGNPTTWQTQAGSTTYAYDSHNRLTEACLTSGCADFIRYTYDEVGNRLTEARPAGTTSYAYNAADQLTQRSGLGGNLTYGYDPNGNQTAAGNTTFTYDLANRLKAASIRRGTTTTYSYDGDGKRLQASTGSGATNKTNYLWDDANPLPQLALERDGNNAMLRRYVHGNDLVQMTTGGADFFNHHDGIGSVVNLTNSSGVPQWSYSYEPFGATRTETKNDPAAPANLMRFTGELYDAAHSLYHLRARQYDPATGRFLTTDPIAPEIIDPYVANYIYANNRPTVFVDPSGERGIRAAYSEFHFPIDRVQALGRIRIGFFIAAPVAKLGPFSLAGDDRGFDPFADPSSHRALIILDFETGTGYARANPTCNADSSRCNHAFPWTSNFTGSTLQHAPVVGAKLRANRLRYSRDRGGFRIEYNLLNSLGPSGPSISGSIWIWPPPHGEFEFGLKAGLVAGAGSDPSASSTRASVSVCVDTFPSLEIYQDLRDGAGGTRTSTLFLQAETNPLALFPLPRDCG